MNVNTIMSLFYVKSLIRHKWRVLLLQLELKNKVMVQGEKNEVIQLVRDN